MTGMPCGWQTRMIPSTSAAVYGWGFDRRHVSERRLAELRVPPSEATGIVLVHGSDDAFPCEERGYLPLSREECLRCGAGYVALGHIHSHRVVAERKGVLAAYPGSPESLTFGQTAAHGAIVGTVGREGNDLRLVPVGRREHCALDVAVDGAATVEEVAARVAGAVGPEDRAAHLYRVTLTGEVDPDLDIAPALVEEKLKGEFHYLDVRDLTRPAFDLEEIARENSLRGRFVSELLDERRNAPEAERAEIDLALRYGLRALGGGR